MLPNTNSADSTSVLNDTIRRNANAINAIGGYFNTNLQLTEANGGTGANLSTAPNGSILVQNASNVGIGTFGQGTSGQVLISQGAGNNPIFGAVVWPSNIQVFTSSGTWTKPAGVGSVYVKVWGAGGGGADNVTSGTDGGLSSFVGTTVITGAGGIKGTNAGVAGTGGTGSNGQINLTGQTGLTGSAGIGGTPPMGIGFPKTATSGPAIGYGYGGNAGNNGASAGAGGYSEGYTAVTGNVTVTVGAAGNAGGGVSTNGGGGYVIVYY